MPPSRVIVPEIVTQCFLALSFWIATGTLGTLGLMVPEKWTCPPRWTWVRVVLVPTTTETLTVRIGLTTDVLSVTSTRYCVVSGTESRAKENAPCALVSWTLPTFVNLPVNGNGFCCRRIGRPALPVPESVPASVEGAPKATGFGVAASASPSGCLGVVNVRSPPTVVPTLLRATRR